MPASISKVTLSKEEVYEIIETICASRDLVLPEPWRKDFGAHVPLPKGISSFRALRTELCERVRLLFDQSPSLGDKYGEIHSQVASDVRLKIANLLGFGEIMAKPEPSLGNRSPKETLELFLSTLKPDQPWQRSTLSAWSPNGVPMGRNLISVVSPKLGGFDRKVVEAILGGKAKAAMEKNPFTGRKERVQTVYDARRYAKEFLRSLVGNATWTPADLKEWQASDGTPGHDLWVWFSKRMRGELDRVSELKRLLGPDAEQLLERNPFNMRVNQIHGWKDIKEGILAFLEERPAGKPWSTVELWAWETNRWNGHNLYKYFSAQKRSFNLGTLKEVLGDRMAILDEKPLEMIAHKVKSPEDARKYLIAFLSTLKPGTAWSTADLLSRDQIGEGGPSGATLMAWMWSRFREGDDARSEQAIQALLGDEAETLLKTYPFQRKRVLISAERVRAYLIAFLYELEEGESWSTVDLQRWGEIKDGVKGMEVYDWILRNKHTVDRETLKNLLEKEEGLLDRFPFSPKLRKQIESPEQAMRRFNEIVTSFPKGKVWSPVDLLRFPDKDQNKPTGRSVYKWIIAHHSSDEGMLTKECLQAFLGKDQGIVATHPFMCAPRIRSIQDAKTHLMAFLSELAEGSCWGPATLEGSGRIGGENGLLGTTIYQWFIRNVRHENRVDWLFVLCKMLDADTLRRHPFKHRNIEKLDVRVKSVPSHAPVMAKGKSKLHDPEWILSKVMTPMPNPEEALMMKERLEERIKGLDRGVQKKIQRFREGEDLPEDELRMIIESLDSLSDMEYEGDPGDNRPGWEFDSKGGMIYSA